MECKPLGRGLGRWSAISKAWSSVFFYGVITQAQRKIPVHRWWSPHNMIFPLSLPFIVDFPIHTHGKNLHVYKGFPSHVAWLPRWVGLMGEVTFHENVIAKHGHDWVMSKKNVQLWGKNHEKTHDFVWQPRFWISVHLRYYEEPKWQQVFGTMAMIPQMINAVQVANSWIMGNCSSEDLPTYSVWNRSSKIVPPTGWRNSPGFTTCGLLATLLLHTWWTNMFQFYLSRWIIYLS